jgi:hypothetical protein
MDYHQYLARYLASFVRSTITKNKQDRLAKNWQDDVYQE